MQRPKSTRELCSARAGVNGRDYHAIRMCNLPEQASDAPLDPDLRPLTHGTPVWQSGEASATYIRGMLLPRLASDLYTLSSEVLMDGAAKVTVLFPEPTLSGGLIRPTAEAQSLAEHLRVELDEANGHRASVEADLEKARLESASMERQLADLDEWLEDSEGQLRSARAKVQQMEIELLDLARSKEALREDLPKRAIEKYKESPWFEMGFVGTGWVSLEYGYQLALARLQARHPRVEIELDPLSPFPRMPTRGFKFFGKRSHCQITLSGFPGVSSDFSYPSPGREFHDLVVRRDHYPEFVERGPVDDGVVRRGERHHDE
ncbi:hypothetical protein B296_00059010 [Ensete ventricosum]|uniref:Uncharacterized protein n=1 Tax=Ensete ventricosum TaxID=4639 RepID=A0A426X409_ENSVE|nr:hypothetical protein B296_00059010 [Ensete ventricosum]